MRRLARFAGSVVVALGLGLAPMGAAHAAGSRTVAVEGGGCAGGAAVVVSIDGARVSASVADARGNYDVSVDLPDSPQSADVTVTCGSLSYRISVPGQADDRRSRLGLAALVVGVGAVLTTMIVLVRRRNVIDLRDPPLVIDNPAPITIPEPKKSEAGR